MDNKKDLMGSGILFIIFLALIAVLKTVDIEATGPEGTSIGLSGINNAIHNVLGYNNIFYNISKILGLIPFVIVGCFVLLGIVQLIQRKSVFKVDRNIITMGLLYIITAFFYVLFEKIIINYRPILMGEETFPEASFPSSHTLIAIVVMLSACMNIDFYVKNRSIRKIIRILLLATAALIVVTRALSGVHWFTDILGGMLLGIALTMFYSGIMGRPRRKKDD